MHLVLSVFTFRSDDVLALQIELGILAKSSSWSVLPTKTSSSSCSGRIRFDSFSLYPQNEIGPSISSSVVLCVFVFLVYIVMLV